MSEFATAPGKKTSEYSATLFTNFISALVALIALFSPGFHLSTATQAVIVSFATAAMGLSTSVYTHVRGQIKRQDR